MTISKWKLRPRLCTHLLITSVMAAYTDIVNYIHCLIFHGGLMFTGKLSDRNQSDIKNIELIFPCLTSTVF